MNPNNLGCCSSSNSVYFVIFRRRRKCSTKKTRKNCTWSIFFLPLFNGLLLGLCTKSWLWHYACWVIFIGRRCCESAKKTRKNRKQQHTISQFFIFRLVEFCRFHRVWSFAWICNGRFWRSPKTKNCNALSSLLNAIKPLVFLLNICEIVSKETIVNFFL